MKEINIRLIEIQKNLDAPKNQMNYFGNYKYRSCEDILAALKPLLNDTGCSLTISDEVVMLGNRYYVKARATLTYGEECITVSAFAREAETKKGMDESQITGAASSYARKYALNGLFAIDDTKDADTKDNREFKPSFPGKQKANNPTPKPMSKEIFYCTAKDCGIEITEKVAKYSQDHFGDVLCMDCQKKA